MVTFETTSLSLHQGTVSTVTNETVAAIICIGTSLPADREGADDTVAGSSLKIRFVNQADGATLLTFPCHPEDASNLATQRQLLAAAPSRFFDVVVSRLRALMKKAGIPLAALRSVQIGFPGRLKGRRLTLAPNHYSRNGGYLLENWTSVDIQDHMQAALSSDEVEVTVLNDTVPQMFALVIFLSQKRSEDCLRQNDHIQLINTGSGCGCVEARVLGSTIVIDPTEQGFSIHAPRDSWGISCNQHLPQQLETHYASTRAMTRNYFELTQTSVECAEIIRRATQPQNVFANIAARKVIERYIEGLAVLIWNGITRGINRVAVCGFLATAINDSRVASGLPGLYDSIRKEFIPYQREDLMQDVIFDSIESIDGIETGAYIANARPLTDDSSTILIDRASLSAS